MAPKQSSQQSIGAHLSLHGWVLIRGADEGSHLAVSQSLGKVVPSVKGGPLVDTLRTIDRGGAKPGSLSSLHGYGAFPFHTDSAGHRVPPRYIVISYRGSVQCSRRTLLVDTAGFDLLNPHAATLHREPWYVNGGRGRFYASILSTYNRGLHTACRYDERFMTPVVASPLSGTILMQYVNAAPKIHIDWQPGSLLVFDNSRMLHAREGGSAPDESRILLRSLVQGVD